MFTSTEQGISDMGVVRRQIGVVHKTIIHHFHEVGQAVECGVSARVEDVTRRNEALRITTEAKPSPIRNKRGQRLGAVR